MKKNIFNVLIDAFSLIVLMSMISTGLILKFILPPGSGRIERLMHGEGRSKKTIDLFMGLARHEWGDIHFYIAFIFLVLIVAHLILHWSWLKAVTFGTKTSPQTLRRKVVTIGVMVFIVLALAFPWLTQKKPCTRTEFQQLNGHL